MLSSLYFWRKKIIVSCDTSAHQFIQQGMNRDPGKLELKSSNVSHWDFSTFPFYLALRIGWFNANLAILHIKRFCHPILIQIWQSCTMAMVRHGRAFMAANSLMNKSNMVDKSNNGTSHLLNVFSSLHTFRQVFAQVKGCLFQSMHKTRSKLIDVSNIKVAASRWGGKTWIWVDRVSHLWGEMFIL